MIFGRRTNRLLQRSYEAGFTLVELMIASSIFLLVTAGLLISFTSLLRNYDAVKLYAAHHADEMRISDYLALDFRRAIAVPPAAQLKPNDIMIDIPAYYDANDVPQTPSLDGKGGVQYGGSGSKVTIHYYLSNADDTCLDCAACGKTCDSIYRKEGDKPATKVADNVAGFIFTGTTSDLGKVISTKVTFNAIFSSTGASREPSTFYNKTLLRNKIY